LGHADSGQPPLIQEERFFDDSTTNRIPSPNYRVLVRMNLPLRFRRTAITATVFLIARSLIAPAITAADTGNLAPITTMPANDTSLAPNFF